jgi:hypothetical protein
VKGWGIVALLVAFIAVVAFTGDSRSRSTSPAPAPEFSGTFYTQDNRTGLCFLAIRGAGKTFTEVPCSPAVLDQVEGGR